MQAEIIHQSGTWVATLVPFALLVGLGALIGSLWSRRRYRENWLIDPTGDMDVAVDGLSDPVELGPGGGQSETSGISTRP